MILTPPTKANLIKMKEELTLAMEGYELLDRKREILLKELSELTSKERDARKRLHFKLEERYGDFRKLRIDAGPSLMKYITMPRKDSVEISKLELSVMGAKVEKLKIEKSSIPLQSVPALGVKLDRFIINMRELLQLIVEYSELHISTRRVAAEIRKTQKRLKALENIHIPNYRESISFITSSLEESERDELARYKKLKKRKS